MENACHAYVAWRAAALCPAEVEFSPTAALVCPVCRTCPRATCIGQIAEAANAGLLEAVMLLV